MTDLAHRSAHPVRPAGAAGIEVFARSGLLAAGATGLDDARLRTRCGRSLPFSASRWHAPAAREEVEVLARVDGPVLDLACGPGRLVHHLVERGVVAVGVDAAADAIAAARRRGAPALLRDLWAALPLEGSWRTVLLFDGNIGIGGNPVALLDRCRRLLAPGGTALVEVGGPATGSLAVEARIEWGSWGSAWFPWATVSVDHVGDVAQASAFDVVGVQAGGGRWFAHLAPTGEVAGVAA